MMNFLGFTENSIGALAITVISVIVSAYFWRIKEKSRATFYLAIYFTFNTILFLSWLVTSSAIGPLQHIFVPPQFLASQIAISAMLLFAYEYPDNGLPRARRVSTFLIGILFFTSTILSIWFWWSWVSLGARMYSILQGISSSILVLNLLVLSTFGVQTVRLSRLAAGGEELSAWQALRQPQGRYARVMRSFGLIMLANVTLNILNIIFTEDVIPPELYYTLFFLGTMLGVTLFMLIYLNNTLEQASFMSKLLTGTILAVMTVIGTVGFLSVGRYPAEFFARHQDELVYIERTLSNGLVPAEAFDQIPNNAVYVARYPLDAPNGRLGSDFTLLYNATQRTDESLTPRPTTPIPGDSIQQNTLAPADIVDGERYFREKSGLLYAPISTPNPNNDFFVYHFTIDPFRYEVGFDYLDYRASMHAKSRVFVMAILLSTLFIILVYPYLFRSTLINPLQRLLDGVRKVNRGELEVEVPVSYTDEIGFLTNSFNRMVDSIRTQKQQLELYNVELEQRVNRRTAQLAKAKEEAEKARTEAEAANQAKGSFLANMSHELRTPLNAIVGYSEILEEETRLANGTKGGGLVEIQRIKSAGEKLLRFINDVLDLSKVESGQMNIYQENIDLALLAGEVMALSEPIARKRNNRLHVDFQATYKSLNSDYVKVRQVLLNLVSNATKFTEEGEIFLLVQDAQLSNGRPGVEFQVRDTGIGIAAEQLDNIFEPFRQAEESTTRKFGGTGLGLSICHHLCQLLGGEISVTSEEGEGSCFIVRLPSLEETALSA